MEIGNSLGAIAVTRLRSPSYPSISLSEAIDYARKVHEKSRTSMVDREAAVKDMGYSGLTGRSLTIIAGVLQFGLLEKAGKGGVRVSKVAVDILHGLTDEIKKAALLKAGTAPALYQELAERFPEGPPSENALRSYLIQRDFADAAIAPAITSYLETYRFLENANVIDGHGLVIGEAPPSPDVESVPEPVMHTEANIAPVMPPTPPLATTIGKALTQGRSLEPNEVYLDIRGSREVHVEGLLDYDGILDLEEKIKALKMILKKPAPSAPSLEHDI